MSVGARSIRGERVPPMVIIIAASLGCKSHRTAGDWAPAQSDPNCIWKEVRHPKQDAEVLTAWALQ